MAKQKGTKAIQEKAQRPPQKGSKSKGGGGGGGDSDTFLFPTSKISTKNFHKKKNARRHGTETAQLTQLHFNAIMYAMRHDLTLV